MILFGMNIAIPFLVGEMSKKAIMIGQKLLLPVWMSLCLLILGTCGPSTSKEYFGEFYANDCGVSHGGFEWAGGYTASLMIEGKSGSLHISFSIGLGDYLMKHEFQVTDFVEAGGRMGFRLEGKPAYLVLVEEDRIWNGTYNGYFMANNSDLDTEKIGQLPISAFPGYRAHYYIELRLKPSGS